MIDTLTDITKQVVDNFEIIAVSVASIIAAVITIIKLIRKRVK